jgi:hypothetical protein
MSLTTSEQGAAVGFADDAPVMVRYPRTPGQLWGDRAEWPWLLGTIL